MTKKKISINEISKLINLTEDHDISVLVDNCLAKTKIIGILNENNFTNEDGVLIKEYF